jgi:hypothetical protein
MKFPSGCWVAIRAQARFLPLGAKVIILDSSIVSSDARLWILPRRIRQNDWKGSLKIKRPIAPTDLHYLGDLFRTARLRFSPPDLTRNSEYFFFAPRHNLPLLVFGQRRHIGRG